jgi:hypothetical protein
MNPIKAILTTILICTISTLFGQTNASGPKGYLNYNEYKQNQPSLSLDIELKKRTKGDIFMTGGISNYKLTKLSQNDYDRVVKEIWGVKIEDSVYINSYPYSKIKGYNTLLEIGYYTFFIGEPARTEKEQRELGIIKPTEKKIGVCCNVGYVLLQDGTIKLLRPELLSELCKDNKELSKEIEAADLKLNDVYKMFDFLKRYNSTKK